MLKNYFKLAYRSLLKSKVSSTINLLGLSLTIGCGILAYLYVSSEISRDTFHERADRIYLVEHTVNTEQGIEEHGKSPTPLGPAMRANLPQITNTVRIAESQLLVVTEDFHYTEFARFVDPAFLDVFSFPLRYGSLNALENINSVVLNLDTASKYFGVENPMGKTIWLKINDEEEKAFTVAGVAEKLPINTSLGFSILLPIDALQDAVAQSDWSNQVRATFVEVSEPINSITLGSALQPLVAAHNAAAPIDKQIEAFSLKNIKDLSLHSRDVKNTIAYRVNWGPIIVLCTITGFLFLLSCFNYLNISLGAAHRRLREIGVRKVMGSRRSQLIYQFLTENIVLTLLALVAGIIIARAFLIPGFAFITNGLNLAFSFSERIDLWLFLGGLVLLLGAASGAYPALYISSFKPVKIFAGRFQTGGPSRFMLSLLSIQFVLAMITMVLSVGLTLNNRYLEDIDWGYDKENTLVVRLGPESYDIMHQTAMQVPQVSNVAGARNHVGVHPLHATTFQVNNASHEAFEFLVDAAYFEVVKPTVLQGTIPESPDKILINAQMAETLGYSNAVDQVVVIDSVAYQIAGITENIHYQNFSTEIAPSFFRIGDKDSFVFLAMRFADGTEQQTVETLAAAWNKHVPETSFSWFFQDTVFDWYFTESGRIMSIFYFAAIFAMLLSCAGLFGLVAQQISSRMKEMSIRKILGASIGQIVGLVNRKFLVLLVIAAVIALPISYAILSMLMNELSAYHLSLGPLPFAISIGLLVLTITLTLSSQIFSLATADPVKALRSE